MSRRVIDTCAVDEGVGRYAVHVASEPKAAAKDPAVESWSARNEQGRSRGAAGANPASGMTIHWRIPVALERVTMRRKRRSLSVAIRAGDGRARVEPAVRASTGPLVIRFGALGDMLLLTPLLHALHSRFGQPCTVVGSGGWLGPLFAGHPDVCGTLKLASRKRPYWLDAGQRRFVAVLRVQPPRPVYVCDDYAVDKIRWLLRRAGIPDAWCVFANPDCVLRKSEHWIDRWRRFVAMTPAAFAATAECDPHDFPGAPYVAVNAADRSDLDAWLRASGLGDAPLVLLQPGNKRTLKRGRAGQLADDKHWPVANWVGLIRSVLEEQPKLKMVLCGAPQETALLRSIADAAGSDRVLAAGDQLPLRRLLALCERASAMISVDTGPAHAAAALGCPLIVLYGNQPRSLWLPRSPTGSQVVALGGLPLRGRVDQIPVEEVVAAWRTLTLRTRNGSSAMAYAACSPS